MRSWSVKSCARKKNLLNSLLSFIFHISFLFFLSFHIKLPSESAIIFEKVSSYAVIVGVA